MVPLCFIGILVARKELIMLLKNDTRGASEEEVIRNERTTGKLIS
jgi:hypothetical protein